jgi:haloacetate dehalogenase
MIDATIFPGFETFRVTTDGASIYGVKGGDGPPVLLLHGWPQSHLEWCRIAPGLARNFTVVAMDLRGYGDSSKPPDDAAHSSYSKREMARDAVTVMRHFGFERFAVVGHDRGGRVGHRLALDHAECVSSLTVIDIVPTLKLYSEVTKEFATLYFHWFFLIQPAPVPETLIGTNAEFWLRGLFTGQIPSAISEEVFAEYLRCFKDPATLHAMCEDYRAAASIDLEHDRADIQEKIRCPLLVLWGQYAAMHPLYDVLATWRERASDVRGKALPGGHWLPEQLPEQLLAELTAFLA